jgi:hypothetical protein
MRGMRKAISYSLLLIFGSFAVWLYWPGHRAIATIERLGGTVQPMTLPECQGRFAITLPATITDHDLEHLDALDRLDPVWLQLQGQGITGRGVASLKRLRSLRGLTLYGTGIGDDDLLVLQSFPDLATLNLDGSKFSLRALEHLKNLPALRCVSLRVTSLPREAVLQFQAECPDLLVLSEFTDKNDD